MVQIKYISTINTYFLVVCRKYNDMLSAQKTPHVVLDFTMTGVGSETIKSFTAALALPTISGSFGQTGDLRQWRFLNANQTKYLLQVMPPADILPESIRAVVTKQDITNAAIIFDEYFGKNQYQLVNNVSCSYKSNCG